MRALLLAALLGLAGCNMDPVRHCETNNDCVGATTPFDIATWCDTSTHSCVRKVDPEVDAGPTPDAGNGYWVLSLDAPTGPTVGAHVALHATLTAVDAAYPYPAHVQCWAVPSTGRYENVALAEEDGGDYAGTWAPAHDGQYYLYAVYPNAPGTQPEVYSDTVSLTVDRRLP